MSYHGTLEGLRATIGAALPRGAVRDTLMTTSWDVSGSCQAPVGVELMARPGRYQHKHITVMPGLPIPSRLILETRCRKCPNCLKARALMWAQRAQTELRCSVRTWFGTMTLSPTNQLKFLSLARKYEIDNGEDFDALSEGEQFKARVALIGKEVTTYFKRVRKASGAPIRYILVAERHESGDPHFHVLVHETLIDQPCRKHHLRDQWELGFSRWKLIDPETGVKAAWYVCKYIAKASVARVRASVRYGQPPQGIETLMKVVRENTTINPRLDTRQIK